MCIRTYVYMYMYVYMYVCMYVYMSVRCGAVDVFCRTNVHAYEVM